MKKLKLIITAALIFTNAIIYCLPVHAQNERKTAFRADLKKSPAKQTPSVFENPALVAAFIQFVLERERGKRILVLFPYSQPLWKFATQKSITSAPPLAPTHASSGAPGWLASSRNLGPWR